MLGSLLTRIRENKGLSKTTLADMTKINVGHLTHIEKGERKPSPSALRSICMALDVPYWPVSCAYEKELTDEQERYNLINCISYNKIPLVNNIEDMIDCPAKFPNASLAFIMKDDSMKSSAPKGSTLFLEYNVIPLHRELGLFIYDGNYLVRRIVYRKNKIVLKSDNLLSRDIVIEDNSKFTIVGRVNVEN